MTSERFRDIVAAYGAHTRRWPHDERADAEAWMRAHPAEAAAVLGEAAELDAWLALDAVAAPAPALVERIAATAPGPRRTRRRGQAWWSGAAFAGWGSQGRSRGGRRVDADARQPAAVARSRLPDDEFRRTERRLGEQ